MTPRQSRTNRSGQPYRYAEEALHLRVERFAVDERDPGTPDVENHTVDVSGYGEWETLEIQGRVTFDDSVLSRVVPESEYDVPPLRLVLKLDTLDTQRRLPVEVTPSPLDSVDDGTDRSYDFSHTFHWKDVYRVAELEPRLVRSTDCREGLPYAPKAGLHVANGESVTLLLERSEDRGGGFPSMYQDFSDEDLEYDQDLVHVLGGTRADPKVLVNSHNDHVVDVLESGRGGGFRPRMGKVVATEVSRMAYVQLLLHTAGTIAENGECEYGWQRGLIEELGDHLYPEMDDEETEAHLGEQVGDPGNLREFADEINRALQLYTEQSYHLENHIARDGP